MPPVRLTWYQGEEKPEPWRDRGDPEVGQRRAVRRRRRGCCCPTTASIVLLPEKDFRDFKRPEPSIPKSLGHHAEWIHACKTGAPTTCNFEYAGWLTEANHLGNVAYRAGKKLEWDAAGLRATNAPEAERSSAASTARAWKLA